MLILAVDIGTTSMKMGVFRLADSTLSLVKEFSQEYEVNIYNNGLCGDIEQDKWNEALSVYGSGGLSSLDEDSVTYKDALKRVVRHVHAISLYGRKAPAAGFLS